MTVFSVARVLGLDVLAADELAVVPDAEQEGPLLRRLVPRHRQYHCAMFGPELLSGGFGARAC